jgi:predicted PurR-regulated permease PerM
MLATNSMSRPSLIAPIIPRNDDEPDGPPVEVNNKRALRFAMAVLVALAVFTILPMWLPLVLAAWSALLARPLRRRVTRLVGGRSRAAGVVTVVLVLAVLTPVVITLLSLSGSVVDLITRLSATENGAQAMGALFASEHDNGAKPHIDFSDTRQMVELLQQHGASALGAVRTLFGAFAAVGIGLFVFVFAFYTFLVDGPRVYDWLLEYAPLSRGHSARMAAAFEETGRGLFLSLGGTALIQGGLAMIGYLVIGVPQALILGMLTMVGSFIPIVGTGLVWVPVALGMLLLDRDGQAIAVLVLGLVVSSLDNFVRPWLSRYGHLQLPTFVTFIAMLGGLAAFGAAGPLIGPLVVRLAVEALQIWKNERSSGLVQPNGQRIERSIETEAPTR